MVILWVEKYQFLLMVNFLALAYLDNILYFLKKITQSHVSPITIGQMHLFSKKVCELTKNDANNPLAVTLNVDFELVKDCYVIEKKWMDRVESGEITEDFLRDAISSCNNVVKQIEMTLKVIK